MSQELKTRSAMRGFRGAVAAGSAVLVLTGCDDFFSVKNPGAITPTDLENVQLLPAIRLIPEAAGAETHDTYVRAIGLISQDLMEWQTRADDIAQDDGLLELSNAALAGLYDDLAANVWVIREARRRLETMEADPSKSQAISQSYFWEGQILIDMADAFVGVTAEGGPPMTPVETYNLAIQILKDGLPHAQASGLNTDYIAGFYGLMARAERQKFFEPGGSQANLTQAAAYATQALSTKANFIVNARYTVAPGNTNSIQVDFGLGRGRTPLGVEDTYGAGWKDPFTGQNDARVMNGICGPGCASYQANAQSATLATGPRGGLYFITKYSAPASPIPVIRWQEAQLIIAEERLEANDLGAAVTRINNVRLGATPAQTAFASAVKETIKNQLIYERQTEFFAEGRNWQDLRNYKIFPRRWTPQARAAGIERRLPISPREIQANPNF